MKITILITYFVLVIGVGIYSFFKIKNPTDYFIAGKNNGVWQVAGSLMATILGGSAILGSVNLAGVEGWASAWYLLAASIGLFLLIPLVGFVNRLGKFTLANLLGQFYGENARKAASVIIPIAWTGIVAAQIIAASKILFSFFGISYELGVIISGSVFIIYTLVGGQVSILKTDFIQSAIIIIGLLISAGYLLGVSDVTIPKMTESFPFNPDFSGVDLLILLLTFSSTFVVGPDIYSRLFCAKNEQVAKKSVITVAIILIPIAFLLAFLGVFAYNNLPAESLKGSVALIELINHYLPDWSVGLMAAALLSAVLSSADTTLLTASMMLSELIKSDIDNPASLRNTRLFIVSVGIFSMLIAIKITSIIGSLLLALAFYSGAFIIPLIAALLNWKVNKRLSILAMGLGGFLALFGKIADSTLGLSIGNYVIIAAFAINLGILLVPEKASPTPQS
ncbi:sodium:solute symporter family protein [Sunxiuqinia sp. A32]|uniref:sodium:solute symporter family protein n=1 Tax=Sunxiuqinia sp. A32 TaxID=3461496 RepID=UPI004045336E